MIEKFKYEFFYKTEDRINLKIKNPDALSKLKQVKSVILDKNQTITNNEFIINGLLIFNEFYEINDNEIPILRDLLSQSKNDKSLRFNKEKKLESLSSKEIPLEKNDASLKLEKNPTLSPYLITNDSKIAFITNQENPDPLQTENISIPNFTLINEFEDHHHHSDKFPINYKQDISILTKKTSQSDFKIKPLKNLDSIKSSVVVNPLSFESDDEIIRRKKYDLRLSLTNKKSFKELCHENFNDIDDLLRSLILCHFTKTKIDTKTQIFTHESTHSQTSHILEFCEKFGYSFKGSFKINDSKIPVYEIKSALYSEFYPIICFNELTKKRARFSLIIGKPFKNNDEIALNEGGTLYTHSDDADDMIPILNLSNREKETLKERIEKLREKGNITIIYAKKEMGSEDTRRFLKRQKIIKTSLTIKDEELESLYNSIEERLDLVCVVCLKEKLRPHITETIMNFHDAQIKVYFVSGDNECLTLASAFHSGIISSQSIEVLKIQVNNQNSALISLKWILQKVQKTIKGSNRNNRSEVSPKNSEFNFGDMSPLSPKKVGFDFSFRKVAGSRSFPENNNIEENKTLCILMDGESFRIVYKNKYLRNHFLFLMMFCKLVCFNFSAIDKKNLAKLIKILDNSTNNFVLGIGDGYDDVLMMKKCDISIEIKNMNDETVTFMGDFIVTDFKKVLEMILFRATELFIKNEEISFYLFYIMSSLHINLFYFSWFNLFTGTELIASSNFDALTLIMCFHIIVVYFLFEKKKTSTLTKLFPIIFKNDMRLKKVEFKKMCIKIFLPAIIDASIVFFFSFFSAAYYSGCNKSITQMNIILNISYYIIFCLKVFYFN